MFVWAYGHVAPYSYFPDLPWFLTKFLLPWVWYWRHRAVSRPASRRLSQAHSTRGGGSSSLITPSHPLVRYKMLAVNRVVRYDPLQSIWSMVRQSESPRGLTDVNSRIGVSSASFCTVSELDRRLVSRVKVGILTIDSQNQSRFLLARSSARCVRWSVSDARKWLTQFIILSLAVSPVG